jgi:hypothetical protein
LQQTRTATTQTNTIKLEYGTLDLHQIEVILPEGKVVSKIKVMKNATSIKANFKNVADKTVVVFENQELKEKDLISVVIIYLS